jgi:membrane protease YdiL (CAAX protease family)
VTTQPHQPPAQQHDTRAFPARVRSNPVAAIVAIAFAVLVPVLVLVVGLLLPAAGGSVFGSASTLLRQALGDGIILVILAVLVTILGGWRSVLLEPARTRSWWGAGVLAAFAVVTLASFTTPIKAGVGDYLIALLVTAIAVALVEELVYRGVIVAGLRRVAPEWIVWLVSTGVFALTHAFNPNGGVLFQVVMTFFLGSACYLARRLTGTLPGVTSFAVALLVIAVPA